MTSMTPEPSAQASMPPHRAVDAGNEEYQRAVEEVAVHLRRRGVRLTGRESGDEVTAMLESVERFEAAVARGGGDLMVDEPIGDGAPVQPDNEAFVLPRRDDGESAAAFIERIAQATSRALDADSDR